MSFDLGAFSYQINGLSTTVAETVRISLIFAADIPSGAKLYKVTASGYTEITDATFSGRTATFSITDGGVLDADGILNGSISDPVALGAPASGGTTVTTSSGGGGSMGLLELLFGTILLTGWYIRRQHTIAKGMKP